MRADVPAPTPTPTAPAILRASQVVDMIGVSRTTLWRMVKSASFPSPIKLSERAVGWRARDVSAWIESRPTA